MRENENCFFQRRGGRFQTQVKRFICEESINKLNQTCPGGEAEAWVWRLNPPGGNSRQVRVIRVGTERRRGAGEDPDKRETAVHWMEAETYVCLHHSGFL